MWTGIGTLSAMDKHLVVLFLGVVQVETAVQEGWLDPSRSVGRKGSCKGDCRAVGPGQYKSLGPVLVLLGLQLPWPHNSVCPDASVSELSWDPPGPGPSRPVSSFSLLASFYSPSNLGRVSGMSGGPVLGNSSLPERRLASAYLPRLQSGGMGKARSVLPRGASAGGRHTLAHWVVKTGCL